MIEERFMQGCARRYGAVVCDELRAMIRTSGSHQQVTVRFLRGIRQGLWDELLRLRDARGGVAEGVDPIDLDLRSPRGRHRLSGCRLGPPIRRFAPLQEIDFRVMR